MRVKLTEEKITKAQPPTAKDSEAKGTTVAVVGSSGDWFNVRIMATGDTGWMQRQFLTRGVQPKAQESAPAKRKAGPSDAEIAKLLIAQSIATYPGNCPCPYNTDRAGRRCGGRSAHSRPGGYSPYCYPTDVPKAEIEAYRRRLQ